MYTPHVSAGAYVREIDASQRISNVLATIGAVVGEAEKGPVNERVLITSNQEYLNIFGKPHPDRFFMGYTALTFLSQSSRMYVTRVAPGALTAGAYFTVDDPTVMEPNLRLTNFDDGTNNPLGVDNPLDSIHFTPHDPINPNTIGFFCANSPGAWNNSIYLHIRPSAPDQSLVEYSPYRFYVDVYLNYKGVGQQAVESFYVSQIQEKDGFGDQLYIDYVINTYSKYIRVKKNPYCDPVKISEEVYEFLDGAQDGPRASVFDIAQAWELYRDPDLVDVNVLLNGGYPDPIVQRTMDAICRSRMDAVALLDVPTDKQAVSHAVNYSQNTLNLNSSYSSLYAPDVKVYDEHNDIEVWVPLSAFAGGVCAKIDHRAQLWYAPAGIDFGTLKVLEARYTYNQGARDALDEANVNMLRKIPSIGYVIWAQETTQSMDSSLSFLNVRRLMNYLEKSIAIASLYSIYKPNDYILRAELRALVNTWLKKIKGAGGVYEFAVICDESNNTPDVIASGDTILDVYIDPTLAAKRIHLNATVLKTGDTAFRESLAS
jgi:hypothetical protein